MSEFLEVAMTAARAAGELQRAGLRSSLEVREVSRHDVKLQMDVDCEELIRAMLWRAFPNHAILGEEGGGEIAPHVPTWIVDPLDGTVNYSRRVPHFCVSIALQLEGRVIVGVIYDPITDELFATEEGGGAFLNGTRIRVSDIDDLSAAIIGIGCGKSEATMPGVEQAMNKLIYRARKVRIMGAAALDMAYVAMGRYDGFLEAGLRSWDIAAGELLIREAGGRVRLTPAGEFTWDVLVDNGRLALDA